MDPSVAAVDPEHQPSHPPQQQYPNLFYNPSHPPSHGPLYSYYAQSQFSADPVYHHQPYADPSQYPYYDHGHAAAYAQPTVPTHNTATPQPLRPIAPTPTPHPSAADPGVGYYWPEQGNTHAAQPGINPAVAAAIKALSELTQFAERMDAEERARVGMAGMQWQNRSRGMVETFGAQDYVARNHLLDPWAPGMLVEGNRKQRGHSHLGGHPSHGGRRNSKSNLTGPDRRARSIRGRGRGGRGGRSLDRNVGPVKGNEVPSVQGSGVSASRPRPIIPVAWCEICRVDCNSIDVLEHHKKGRRHKKTVKKLAEMEAQQKLIAEHDAKRNQEKFDEENVVTEPKQEAHEQPEYVAVQQPDTENAQDAIATGEVTKAENLGDNTVEKSEVENQEPMMDTKLPLVQMNPVRGHDRSYTFRGSLSRLGRGGKRLRNFDSVTSRTPKRCRTQPIFCKICNVTCDTPAVFEHHLAGKKHLLKSRHLPGRQTTLNPPNYHPSNKKALGLSGNLQPISESRENALADETQATTVVDLQVADSGNGSAMNNLELLEPENKGDSSTFKVDHPSTVDLASAQENDPIQVAPADFDAVVNKTDD